MSNHGMTEQNGCLVDKDENSYNTVIIGRQEWTIENLRVTHYNDGTPIAYFPDSRKWQGRPFPAYCYFNNTSNDYIIKVFGALYNWFVVNPSNPKKIAPEGWRVPTNDDWRDLERYLVEKGHNWDRSKSGNKVAKSMATKLGWSLSKVHGETGCESKSNNASGFSGFPGGYRFYNGIFDFDGNSGYWWSSTESGGADAIGRTLFCNREELIVRNANKRSGLSIRLMRDI